jgi:plastocyanin
VSTSRCALVLLLCVLAPLVAARAGEVRGRIAFGVEGATLDGAGPIVVYLEAVEGKIDVRTPRRSLEIQQKNANFTPAFLAIAAGETVVMPNDDVIFHNVFSYSTPNDFDLGLYARGESRSKTFQYPGVVRIYCSIHESMSATIFIAPSPLFAVAAADGSFALRDVPTGKYRLRTWNRRLPPASQLVDVGAGPPVVTELLVAAGGSR